MTKAGVDKGFSSVACGGQLLSTMALGSTVWGGGMQSHDTADVFVLSRVEQGAVGCRGVCVALRCTALQNVRVY